MSSLPAVHLEDIIQDLGGCGRFQIILTFIVHTMKGVVCFTMVAMTFGAAVPDWWCLDDLIGKNTSDVLGNKSLPQFQSCSYGNGTKVCSIFLYADSMKTVVTEVGIFLSLCFIIFFSRKKVFTPIKEPRKKKQLFDAFSYKTEGYHEGTQKEITSQLEAYLVILSSKTYVWKTS